MLVAFSQENCATIRKHGWIFPVFFSVTFIWLLGLAPGASVQDVQNRANSPVYYEFRKGLIFHEWIALLSMGFAVYSSISWVHKGLACSIVSVLENASVNVPLLLCWNYWYSQGLGTVSGLSITQCFLQLQSSHICGLIPVPLMSNDLMFNPVINSK